MRAVVLAGLAAGVVAIAHDAVSGAIQTPKPDAKSAAKATAAAEFTRTKLLPVKVGGEFNNARLGDILKEFAAQVDMQADQPVMWAYGPGFPFAKKLTFAVKDVPLEEALDELLTKAGGGLGYVIVSKAGDRHDGWVRLTTTGERGTEARPATPEEEKDAAGELADAKKLLDAKKDTSAKVLLEQVVKKYPTAKAAAEARELLGKMDK